MQRQERGFTLIEVLVVVTILAVLMGLISLLVGRSSREKDNMLSKNLVTTVRNAIDNYQLEFSRPPPMTMAELAAQKKWTGLAVQGNVTNECIECLLVALHHPDFSKRLGDVPTSFGNTDSDIWNKVPEGSEDENAREILDAWRNPIAYIHKNAYGQPVKLLKEDGTEIEVMAVKKPNGTYYNPDSYQIISLGPNGVQDDPATEEPDDIENFNRVRD
jgi:prepilin-type N-terminal cleavage/methylation domain-containing protein